MTNGDSPVKDSMKLLLEMRDKQPDIFRRRISENEHQKGVVNPEDNEVTSSPEPINEDVAKRNADKLRSFSESDGKEAGTFDQFKANFYDIGKKLYGIEVGNISDDMLRFEWSQGTTSRELVLSLGRKLGMEQIANPEEYLK